MEELLKKIEELEKRIAALEGQIQAQPRTFIPEDSDKKYYTTGNAEKCEIN